MFAALGSIIDRSVTTVMVVQAPRLPRRFGVRQGEMMFGTIFIVSGVVAAAIAAGWGFHRLCLHLEDRGYMYYRHKSQGGGGLAGVFHDMDRLARPSIEYVIRVQDEAAAEGRDDVGGE